MFHNEAKNGTKVSHVHKSFLGKKKDARKYATTEILIIKIVHGKMPLSPTWTKVQTWDWCKRWGGHHSLLNREELD